MPTLPNWNLSQQSRARMNELLKSAGDLGLDPDAVAAGGLAAFQVLIALKRAKDAGEGADRSQRLIRAQEAIRGLDPTVHGGLLQQIQSRIIALQGRGGDTEVAHVTPGEIVLPKSLQTPEVLAALREAAEEAGMPVDQLRVGSNRNSINPDTGQSEFADSPQEEIEEITITAPRETGIVQAPQNFSGNGFYNYGTPLNGEGQFGVPAAMYVLGAAGHAWNAAGRAPFGVGNMSKADLSSFPPHTGVGHTNGTGIDVRPVRSDGKQIGVNYGHPAYDREATQALVNELLATGGVQKILFDDPEIKGVTPDAKGRHGDHLHVQVNSNYRRSPGK